MVPEKKTRVDWVNAHLFLDVAWDRYIYIYTTPNMIRHWDHSIHLVGSIRWVTLGDPEKKLNLPILSWERGQPKVSLFALCVSVELAMIKLRYSTKPKN